MQDNREPKRLYRSTTDRVFAGVAGGLAEYFNLDPTIVRLIILLLILAPGPGLIFYIGAALIIPNDPRKPLPREYTSA